MTEYLQATVWRDREWIASNETRTSLGLSSTLGAVFICSGYTHGPGQWNVMEGCGAWMTKGTRVDASSTWEISVREKEKGKWLPYDISESVSEENNENGERERRIRSYRW